MNTVFLVPGCLVHKELLVRERRGVTCAFHLLGRFPGRLSRGARPAPAPGDAPAAVRDARSRDLPTTLEGPQSAGSEPEAAPVHRCLGCTWLAACSCHAWVAQQAWLIFTRATNCEVTCQLHSLHMQKQIREGAEADS